MRKKRVNFFEEHVEKMVLGIVALVCLWLLITRVFISPNVVSYDNKKFGSGSIDAHISEQAKALRNKLERKPEPKQAYKPRLGNFVALIDSAISDIDASLTLPQPNKAMEINIKRAYRAPRIGQVNDTKAGHIRTVAYVPTKEIDEGNVDDKTVYVPKNLDFVTVEAEFDIAGLYKSFYESFASVNVKEEWRDPCLAIPIFASVELQRKKLLSDGSWGNWQTIPRTKIDPRKELFKVIEKVEDLPPGGMKVRLLQFDNVGMKIDLLQPEPYRIASAKEEWFPPSLYKQSVRYWQEIEAQEKREARETERQERERERDVMRTQRASRTRSRTAAGAYDEDDLGFGGPINGTVPAPTRQTATARSRGRPTRERERPERTRDIKKPITTDVYDKFDEILITNTTDFANMQQPLVFWAYDDTVEPGKNYQYRIRIGVFNPIAETEQFTEQDKNLNNQVILWSRFSEATKTVTIPKMLYFFPRDIQEATKTVTVQVSRYAMGYWYSKNFMVRQGEVIGKAASAEIVEDQQKEITVPEIIDYSTGAILVDVIPVNDWLGAKSLSPRHYFDMLYSFDGANIERIPVKQRYWAAKLQAKFNEIKKSEKEPKEPLRDWGERRERGRRAVPGIELQGDLL